MQDSGSELRRIPLLGSRVNKGKKWKGRSGKPQPWVIAKLYRLAGLAIATPTPCGGNCPPRPHRIR
jgi:hypothetical protein